MRKSKTLQLTSAGVLQRSSVHTTARFRTVSFLVPQTSIARTSTVICSPSTLSILRAPLCAPWRSVSSNSGHSGGEEKKQEEITFQVPLEPYSPEQLEVNQTHVEPKSTGDKLAYTGVKLVRFFFDIASGYAFGPITSRKLLRRIVFLETVAGVPGMVAGTLRHLKSLRRIQHDQGWIHMLLEEAENERMHLMVFQEVAGTPSILMKTCVAISQAIAWNAFFGFYIIMPRLCHRFVGYVEEEAVHTYTGAINALDNGELKDWEDMRAPDMGIQYWKLAPDAKMRDLLLAVRADEAHHRDVNHALSEVRQDAPNPFQSRGLRPSP